MKKLKYALENSEDIRNNVQERSDGDGAISKLCLWNYAGNDVTGVMARYFSDIQKILVKLPEVQTAYCEVGLNVDWTGLVPLNLQRL